MDEAQRAWLRARVPEIGPPPGEGPRPFWSVVIPTHRRVEFLPKALGSVLAQGLGPEEMEILVADDATEGDAVADLVRRLGGERVAFHRQAENVGQFRNVNGAIGRSRGHWIHVLHDDDYVGPGFYAALRPSLEADGGLGAAMGSTIVFAGRQGSRYFAPRQDSGRIDDWLGQIAVWPAVQTPAVVVRRATYETLGGYNPDFPYPGDWEMWQRIAAHAPWWFQVDAGAFYRNHPASITGTARRSGRDIAEIRAVIAFAQNYLPANRAGAIRQRTERYWAEFACRAAVRFIKMGDHEAAAMQLSEALRTYPGKGVVDAVINLGPKMARASTSTSN